MSNSNGTAPTNVLLFIVNSPAWASDIHAYFAQQGYSLSVATDAVEANSLVQAQKPDAVITLACASDAPIAASIAALFDTNYPPLAVLITDGNGNFSPDYRADLIMRPETVCVDSQSQQLLHARMEAVHLKRQVQKLHDENSSLQMQLKAQRRSTNEIEVLKNAIVRNVSHELKTPLLQVKSAVSLLSEDVGNTKLIDYATDATARLESLVKNITLLGSSLDINPGPVIVRDAVEYSRRNLRRIWQFKDEADRIVVQLQENLPPVMADKQGLSTTLQLLMDNALKFSKDTVEVRAAQLDSVVRISVRDYGIGIAKDEVGHIFDSFYQVDNSSTRRYGGTGVGLAIVRLILERHNTQIHVESEVNRGSTFSFDLPVVNL